MPQLSQLPKVIALCGKKRSGKDTIASYLVEKYGYENVKFAAPLKAAVQALFGFTYDQVENDKEKVDDFWGISPRQAMQFFGVEVVQKKMQELLPGMGRLFFVKSLIANHVNANAKGKDNKIVISDMRFVHEWKAIKEIPGAIVIKIERPDIDDGDKHISEIEIEEIEADFVIQNNTDIEHLYSQVQSVISELC